MYRYHEVAILTSHFGHPRPSVVYFVRVFSYEQVEDPDSSPHWTIKLSGSLCRCLLVSDLLHRVVVRTDGERKRQ